MPVTLRDVAARAGVSKITVSRVINNQPHVRADTRLRVQSAIRDLHYIPNQIASSLRGKQTATLALLLPDITNPYWTAVARGVEDEAERHGYSLFLCNTDERLDKQTRYLELALRRRVDGIILGPAADSAAIVRHVLDRGTRLVLIDRAIEGVRVDVVRADSYSGAYALTEHLLATGRRRIAYVGGPLATSTGLDRLNGYRAALAVAGVAPVSSLIHVGSFSQQTGFRALQALLDMAEPPDAIVTANNQITIGVMIGLEQADRAVPRDVAVVSFDDSPTMNVPTPFLTAAIQPAYRIGQLGAERMLRQSRLAAEAHEFQDIILPVEIVIRRSCGCVPVGRMTTGFRVDNAAILTGS